MVYDQINPPPDPWLQTGLLASLLINLLGGGKRPRKPTDLIPRRKTRADDYVEHEKHQKTFLTRYFTALRKRKE